MNALVAITMSLALNMEDVPEVTEWTVADFDAIVSEIEELASANKANYTSIKFITCTATLRMVGDNPSQPSIEKGTGALREVREPFRRVVHGVVDIVCDFESGASYCKFNVKSAKNEDIGTGKELDLPTLDGNRELIFKGTESWESSLDNANGRFPEDPHIPSFDARSSRIAYQRPETSRLRLGYFSDFVDMRFLLGHEGGLMWVELEGIAKSLKEKLPIPDGSSFSIETRTVKGIKQYRMTLITRGTRMESTFDSAVSGNMVRYAVYEGEGRKPIEAIEIEYQDVGGTFLPKRHFHFTRGPKPTTATRELIFGELALNAPVNDRQFTYHAFNLKKGDRVYSDIEKRLYLIDANGDMISPSEYEELYRSDPSVKKSKTESHRDDGQSLREESGSNLSRVLIVCNIGVILVVVAVILLRKALNNRRN